MLFKNLLRSLLLLVATVLTMNAHAGLKKFIYDPTGSDIKIESWKDFVRGAGSPQRNSYWTSPTTGQTLYVECDPAMYRAHFGGIDLSQVKMYSAAEVTGNYRNTAWNPTTSSIVAETPSYGPVKPGYSYFGIPNGTGKRALAKASCGNPQDWFVEEIPITPTPTTSTYMYTCIPQGMTQAYYVEMGEKTVQNPGQYSKDKNFWVSTAGVWYKRNAAGTGYDPLCPVSVSVVPRKDYRYNYRNYEYRSYNSYRSYCTPQPTYYVQPRRPVYFNLALSFMSQRQPMMMYRQPSYQPRYFYPQQQQRPFQLTGNPFDGGNPYFSNGGNPFDGGGQQGYFNGIPFDGSRNFGGSSFDGNLGRQPGINEWVR